MNFDKAIFDKVNVFLIKHLWVYLFITLFTIFKTVINVLEVGRCEIPNLFTARTKKATLNSFWFFFKLYQNLQILLFPLLSVSWRFQNWIWQNQILWKNSLHYSKLISPKSNFLLFNILSLPFRHKKISPVHLQLLNKKWKIKDWVSYWV